MTRGGARRTRSGVGLFTMKPWASAAAATSAESGRDRSRPTSRPRPRTSGTRSSAASPARRRSPIAVACSSRPSFSMVSRTASAAAQATGLPPKVVPWLPGCRRVAASPRATQAPIGMPPPSPLATVTTSASATGPANHSPVRPMPVCTSSSQSSAPLSRVISRAAARYAAGGTTTPASPWIGSRITAAVWSVTALASAASSPYGTKVTSPGSGSNGARYASFEVSASEPMVRPWKEPSAATRWVRPVRRVSLKAASLASVPELVKKTRPSCGRRATAAARPARPGARW